MFYTYVEEYFSLEDSKNSKQTDMKEQFKEIMENYDKKKLNKINPETINLLIHVVAKTTKNQKIMQILNKLSKIIMISKIK